MSFLYMSSWIIRSLYSILLIFLCCLFRSEIKRTPQTNKHSHVAFDIFYVKLLKLWSNLFFLLSIIFCVMGVIAKIPNICQYILTIYQISRLQYCFSSKQQFGCYLIWKEDSDIQLHNNTNLDNSITKNCNINCFIYIIINWSKFNCFNKFTI